MATPKNVTSAAPSECEGTHALDALHRDHGDWLRALLRRRLRVQSSDADDLVQETYVRIARASAETVERPRAYLVRIALNLFRDGRRRDAVRTAHRADLRLVPPAAPDPGGLCEQEAGLEMERLVLGMPETWRDVFVLSRFRHMSNQDIAHHLGVSIKTVEWRMSKALDYCVRTLRG